MHLEDAVAFVVLVALILYGLMGGADFGAGVWDALAFGPRAQRRRDVIAAAIGPVWEANHVWLILIIVLLFTAWPAAFAAMMVALHIPLTLMLMGIVLRGTAFVFRKYDSKQDGVQRRWSLVFGAASIFTPFVQGMSLGALATGNIRVSGGDVTTGFLAGWLTPFAFSCGFFALVLFAFLAAVYLTVDAAGDPEVQEDFRHLAMSTAVVLLAAAALVFFTSRNGAPEMFRGLTTWWSPMLLLGTLIFAAGAIRSLWRRHYQMARFAAIGEVTTLLLGWCVAQYPCLIYPDQTVANTAAPVPTLRLLLIVLGLGGIVLLPSLYYLFHVFKGERPE